jgi:adenosylmethionine-8-amino-7-oxononanoate aminotransferase
MGNADVVARSLAAVWHPCTQMKHHERFPLVPVARARGAWLEDFEGKRILDGVSSWWVNLFGHAHPAINAALREQLDTLEHVMLAGFTHEPAVRLAERLAAAAPAGLGHAFFASDGASATEIALKMAFHHAANRGRPRKTRFVALEGGYHGETLGALGVTDVAVFRDAYAPARRPDRPLSRARGGRPSLRRPALRARRRGPPRRAPRPAWRRDRGRHRRAARAGRRWHALLPSRVPAPGARALRRA